jgi:hypothetical protein
MPLNECRDIRAGLLFFLPDISKTETLDSQSAALLKSHARSSQIFFEIVDPNIILPTMIFIVSERPCMRGRFFQEFHTSLIS